MEDHEGKGHYSGVRIVTCLEEPSCTVLATFEARMHHKRVLHRLLKGTRTRAVPTAQVPECPHQSARSRLWRATQKVDMINEITPLSLGFTGPQLFEIPLSSGVEQILLTQPAHGDRHWQTHPSWWYPLVPS